MSKSQPSSPSRRRFLGGVLLGGGAAAGVAAGVRFTPTDAEDAATSTDTEPAASTGYRETPHVRRYYETTRS